VGLVLHEVVVLPNSELTGTRLEDIDFDERFGAVFLGVRGRKGLQNKLIGDWKLASGDCLLLAAPRDKSEALHKNFPDLFIVKHTDHSDFSKKNALIAAATVISVIVLAAVNIVPIVTAALAGCLVLVLTKAVSPEEAYKSISWKVIMLLAGFVEFGRSPGKNRYR
jgi:di/tricarboxylate transporter